MAVALLGCGGDDTAADSDGGERRTEDADPSTTGDDGGTGEAGAVGDRDSEGPSEDDHDEPHHADESSSSTTGGAPDPDTSVEPDGSTTTQGTASGEGGGDDDSTSPDAEAVPYRDLQARPDDYVGRTIEVVGRVHFDTRCPPPDQGGAGPCTLVGHLAHESVTHLGPAEVEEAFLLARDGSAVSCTDTDGTGACPGWERGERYRIVADVRHQVRGGRETDEIELEVIQKSIQ